MNGDLRVKRITKYEQIMRVVEQLTKSMEKSDMGATTAASVVSQRIREKYGNSFVSIHIKTGGEL